jgi:hypothetical protein
MKVREYKVITVSQASFSSLAELEERATEKVNEYAIRGWEVVQMSQSRNRFSLPVLTFLLEKEQ